jgi:DNA-binding response OmpR family regulator
MTSFAESDTEDTARSNGADDFFEKPLHPSNLVTRIGDLVTRSRTFGGEVSRSQARETIQALPMAPVPAFPPTGEIS